MDPVTLGAVLLAVVTGLSEALGDRLWPGLVALVRRPSRRNTDLGREASAAPSGEAELTALQHAKGDQQKAVALAEVLLARADADDSFRQALENWWEQAEPVRASIGNVVNTISAGTQQGSVAFGRDFINPTIVTNQPASVPVARAQLPKLVRGFTGRKSELAQLTGLLNPAEQAGALVSAVAGLAGVGKTALAIQAGHAACRAGWFPGGVLFLDLHGYDDRAVQPGQALDALLRALGVAAKHIPPRSEERAALYRSALAQISDPVLIIIDNASAEAQVRPLLPGPGPHRVVVTSRHTLAGLEARLLDIAVLDGDAAVALLDRALRTARPGDDRIGADRSATARLAGICGGLPLALQITAALLKADQRRAVNDLADKLGDEIRSLEALHYDDGSETSVPSVAAAFELSYRQLNEADARVFRLLSVNPGPDVSVAAAAALTDRSAGETRDVIGRLVKAHLVEWTGGAAERCRMHDLLRLYARQLPNAEADAGSDEREQARNRLLDYYLNGARAADDHLRALPGARVPAYFADRNAALSWMDSERPSLVAAVTMAVNTGRDQVAIALPLDLNEYLRRRRRFDDLLAILGMGCNAARRQGNPVDNATILRNLGRALRDVRQFDEAITACRDAAAIFRETGDRRDEGKALRSLGLALVEVRRFNEAITACRDAAAIFRETGDRRDEGMALGNLGLALVEVRQFDEAITAHQDAAVIFRESGDRHNEGKTLNNLGLALVEVRRFDEAITAHRDAAAIFRETRDRHDEGMALNNLGLVLRRVRQFDEAITTCRDAAAIYRETGDRHGEGMAVGNLGLALRRVRRFDEAITTCRDAAAIFREIGDRRDEGKALRSLGRALRRVRQFDEAITTCRDAAAIFREIGDRHGEGMALRGLGLSLVEVQRYEEAITACRDAAAICRETGERHREGKTLYTLGRALRGVRRFEEVITAYQDAAAIFRETGDGHHEAMALRSLGLALLEARQLEEAIRAHEGAAAIFRVTWDRRGEAMALRGLGLALVEVRRYEEAISVCQGAMTIFQETGDRRGEGMALNTLGCALRGVRRFEEAIRAHKGAAGIFRETGDRRGEGMALNNLELDRSARKM